MIGLKITYTVEVDVCVSGMKSDRNFVSCGVPQGSVLGPLLFLLYVNDIGNSVPDIPRKLYANFSYIWQDS